MVMHSLAALYAAVSSQWASAMVRAALQGAVAIAIAVCIARMASRLSPAWRCWLMRLAYARMLLAVVCGAALTLPLLPVPSSPGTRRPPPPVLTLPEVPAAPHPLMAAGPMITTVRSLAPLVRHLHPSASPAAAAPPSGPNLPDFAAMPAVAGTNHRVSPAEWLLALWICGALVSLWMLWREAVRVGRMRRQAVPIDYGEPLVTLTRLCSRFGIPRTPLLLNSRAVEAPMLSGWRRPAILLPDGLARSCSAADLELILAHELAHVRRRDLLWAVLPAIARCLFYFNPMVWLAEHEWREAVEIACDRDVLVLSAASPARYAASILKVVQLRRARRSAIMTAQMAESYSNVKRRLEVMHNHQSGSRSRPFLYGALIFAALLATGTPWQVAAQQPAPASPVVPAPPTSLPAIAAAAGGTLGTSAQPASAPAALNARIGVTEPVLSSPLSAPAGVPALNAPGAVPAPPRPEAEGLAALPVVGHLFAPGPASSAATVRLLSRLPVVGTLFQNPVPKSPQQPESPAPGTAPTDPTRSPALPAVPGPVSAGVAPAQPLLPPAVQADSVMQSQNRAISLPLDAAQQRRLTDAVMRSVTRLLQSYKPGAEGVDKAAIARAVDNAIAEAMKTAGAVSRYPLGIGSVQRQLPDLAGTSSLATTIVAPAVAQAAQQLRNEAQALRTTDATKQRDASGGQTPDVVGPAMEQAAQQLAQAARALRSTAVTQQAIASRNQAFAMGTAMTMARKSITVPQARVMALAAHAVRAQESAALRRELAVTLAQLRVLLAQLSHLVHQQAVHTVVHAHQRSAHRARASRPARPRD
ncbi:MAG: M48 family metalloprotease [Armatimonadetes bacterium]|nr:M48 family metalloprotease [Armatimonadota bacterium]MDE2205606.1 M48 family metalloprotease [Armatimonadota bacterium]